MKQAIPRDAVKILQLYFDTYGGTYPDPRMTDFLTLNSVLASPDYLWLVQEAGEQIAGSVVYQLDRANRLAKVFGAAVRPEFRGENLTERLMSHGRFLLPEIDVVYATTRTVSSAPQKLTSNLGYRKLGIFPNIHRTFEPETHALTAHFSPGAFQRRYDDFKLHPLIQPLYRIVQKECGLPELAVVPGRTLEALSPPSVPAPTVELEVIQAPNFVRRQFTLEKVQAQEHHWFFPFIEPNLMLTDSEATVQVFVNFSTIDQYCALIGIRDELGIGYESIFQSACRALRKLGVRYLEFIIRADEIQKIDVALRSRFIPCAYFPAMQLSASGYRFDYVVFSRSFENLDFKGLKFEGTNQDYIRQYCAFWEESAYEPAIRA